MEDGRTDADTIILEENTTNIIEKQDENVLVLTDKKFSSFIEYIEILRGFTIWRTKSLGCKMSVYGLKNGLYVDLLKNRI